MPYFDFFVKLGVFSSGLFGLSNTPSIFFVV